jgi:hypothetical protein
MSDQEPVTSPPVLSSSRPQRRVVSLPASKELADMTNAFLGALLVPQDVATAIVTPDGKVRISTFPDTASARPLTEQLYDAVPGVTSQDKQASV